MKFKTSRKLQIIFSKVADYFFKDLEFWEVLNPIFIFLYMGAIKLVFVGIETEALTTYFEILASLLLVIILGMQIPLKHKGYVGWCNILIICSGLIWIGANNSFLYEEVAMRFYIFFFCLNIIYLFVNFFYNHLKENYPRRRKIIIRKVRVKK